MTWIAPSRIPSSASWQIRSRAARADTVHGDGQGLVRLGAEGAQGNPRRDQAFADFGNRIDFVDGDRIILEVEGQQIAQGDRRHRVDGLGVFAVGAIAVGRHCLLQQVDLAPLKGVQLAAASVAVKPADRQGDHRFEPCGVVQGDDLLLDAGQANAGNS